MTDHNTFNDKRAILNNKLRLFMPLLSRGPCKQMVKYDGTLLGFSGLNLPLGGAGALDFVLAKFETKRELVQVAAEIAQLLDAAQFANCIQISMVKDEKERIKLINLAMESQAQLVKFALVMRLISSNPTSEAIQNVLAAWIASQTPSISELSTQAKNMPNMRGAPLPDANRIQLSIENVKNTESILTDAIERGADFDEVLDKI